MTDGGADPTERALLLLSLLQTHRFWPGAELTGRLGVSARTLRRDVDRLRALGYPVDATPGASGGYRLGGGRAPPAARCSTTTRPSPSRSGCAPPPARRSTAWRTPRSRALVEARAGAPGPLATAGARGALERRVAPVGRRRRPSTPKRSRCSRSRVATTSRCGSTTGAATATRPVGWSSLTNSCRRGDGGTSWRGTSAATTGARSGSTGSSARDSRACAARRGSCPVGDAAAFVAESIRTMPMPYSALLDVDASADAVRAALHWSDAEVEEIDAGAIACPRREREHRRAAPRRHDARGLVLGRRP